MSNKALTRKMERWAYEKWCEGYTMQEIADALYVSSKLIGRTLRGKQRVKKPAEELCVIANKRLCNQASKETREIVEMMCEEVKKECLEFEDELVPMCVRENGCNEMKPCGRWNR